MTLARSWLIALLALASCASAGQAFPLRGGTNYTSAAQWAAKTFDASNAGAALDPAYYGGTPDFQDTFTDPACANIGAGPFNSIGVHLSGSLKWLSYAGFAGGGGGTSGQAGIVNPGVIFNPIDNPTSAYDCSGGSLKLTQYYHSASFTGSISGNTLTVSSVSSGTLAPNLYITGASASTFIRFQISGAAWGAGTYSVSNAQTVASGSMSLAGWAGAQIVSYQNADASGYLTPQYFYAEASLKLPASMPTGVCFWWSFWFVTPNATNPASEKDDKEGCLKVNALTSVSTTVHDYPPSPALPGMITSARAFQNNTNAFANYDGAFHTYGYLRTPSQDCFYTDRLLEGCVAINGNEERTRLEVLVKLANYFSLANAATDGTASASMYVNRVSVWPCPATHQYCQ